MNELLIMNTTFEKKNIHKYTCQHPGSKQWHCIDYIIMRQSQRRLCRDVSVLRSAECWTDHKLLRAKMKLKCPTKVANAKTRKRFAVIGLLDEHIRKRFNEDVRKAVVDEWCAEASSEQKWGVIRDNMVKTAKRILGHEQMRQPNWYKENEISLNKLIDKRNTLFAEWLNSNQHSDRQRYVAHRRLVAAEIRKAKNEWYQKKTDEVEHGMTTDVVGRGMRQGLREIQRGRRGLQPVRPNVKRNLDGEMCVGISQTLQRWKEHFESVLNISSVYSEDVIETFISNSSEMRWLNHQRKKRLIKQ